MSDVTLLRNNAIVRNSSVGASPPHGPMKTGELPLVQVKMVPGGPQVQEGQQKPVTILPPKDAASAVLTGGLPMVAVKMTQNGPQLEDGRDQPVVIKDGKHGAVATGGLPMIQIKMDGGKPQVQNMPNVAGGPPHLPAAHPVLSAPRVVRAAANQGYVATPTALATVPSHGYVARAAAPGTSQVRIARVAAPQVAQVALPPVPEFTTEQLMLCLHLADKYLADLLAAVETPIEPSAEAPVVSEAIQFAKATIATIDDALVATAVRAEAMALAAQASVAAPAMPTVAAAASTSIAPTPQVAYTAGRVGARSYSMPGARSQRNSAMAPRRTARTASPLPPVIVKMDGQRAVVQNQAEIAQAKAALDAPATETAPEATFAPEVAAPTSTEAPQG